MGVCGKQMGLPIVRQPGRTTVKHPQIKYITCTVKLIFGVPVVEGDKKSPEERANSMVDSWARAASTFLCPQCFGRGKIEQFMPGTEITSDVRCQDCNGTGRTDVPMHAHIVDWGYVKTAGGRSYPREIPPPPADFLESVKQIRKDDERFESVGVENLLETEVSEMAQREKDHERMFDDL
jgi:hypothetical protein